jgi:RNA polymerase sigma-70 factor (ECF subfamily)
LGDTVDLEDLIQAVFVDVLKCIDQLNDVTSVKAWISTIASRRAYRMRETNSRLALGCDYARVAAPHLSAAKHRRMEPTRVALSLIPAPQRLLCSLRYTEGWTLAELARRYTCSLATIKRRLHDARRAVAAQTIILNQHRKI